MAETEASRDIKATYYFRKSKLSFKKPILKRIVELQHEIGYHYEDLAVCAGDYQAAIQSFQKNLELFREFYPVKTICMHGSSGSPYDNRDLWKKYDMQDYGIICEPYLSIDYDKVLYLSDTGRRWNGFKMSLRDNVKTKYDFNFTRTWEIVDAVDKLPDQILFTAHPEQWVDNFPEWLYVKGFSILHSLYKVYYRNRKIKKEMNNSGKE